MIDREKTFEMIKTMVLDCSEMGEKINGLRERIETIESADKHITIQKDHGDDPSTLSTDKNTI